MKYTQLVNKENLWKEKQLEKIELVEANDIDNNRIKIEKKTKESYELLKKCLKTRNIEIGITDAFRTAEEQEKIKERLSQEKGTDYVKNYVANPYESEHHTGLAIDIAIKKDNEYFDEENENTKEDYKIIHETLHKYGFILRYPKGKEKITGYNYEPWHIRYIGKVPSQIIYNNNLTLEEYLKDFKTVLYINKPKGVTSFDVVNDIRHIFGIKKVGHTGTLDPLAEGVMIVALGKATKIVELLTAEDKEYIAEVELGYKTDTYDNTGTILSKKEIPKNLHLKEVINSFKKTYLQEVPIYSAIKVKGKKLYDYARKNEKIILPKKEVTIKEIELLSHDNNSFTFKALVTKGCYIRSLIQDIGTSLGTYATMTNLLRTKQGKILLKDTNTIEEIKNNNYKLYNIEDVLNYPKIKVEKSELLKISNGVKINNKWNISNKVIFLNQENKIISIYEKENDCLKPWKNFV